MKNISYSYPNGKIALKNIDIEFKVGQMIALVGQSGSGKSTILDLIAGLNKVSRENFYRWKKICMNLKKKVIKIRLAMLILT